MRALLAFTSALSIGLALAATPSVAQAGQYVVHVHGRGQSGWGDNPMYSQPGWQTVGVSYNATTATLAQANAQLRPQLAQFCSGSNSCIIVAYSNGALQLGYTQANYPSVLANALYVEAGGAASGGTELLNSWTSTVGSWLGATYPNGVDATLTVSGARNAYNHSLSAGINTYHLGGNTGPGNAIWWATSGFISGDDDSVVPFHSAFGCSSSGSQTQNCSKFSGHALDVWANVSGNSRNCPNGVCGGVDHFGIDDRAAYWY
ncbi:MAG: hypothetical protein MUF34_24395 [Polyangiaceae bacterium]|nr:hypothetical protein [Polyangiaceae bacterium]